MAPAPPVFYLIPGLGADARVFQFLSLHGDVHVLRWLPPKRSDEPLPHYAARLATAVPVAQACWLVGVSFGGVLALEIARLRPSARVVLISSLTEPSELPWLGKLARATGLYRLLPPQLLPRLPRVAQWFFSVKNGREYQLLRQILRDTDPNFTRWAIARLLQWPGRATTAAIRIHGTTDRLLPNGAAHSQYQLPGGHLIIISRAAEISRIFEQPSCSGDHNAAGTISRPRRANVFRALRHSAFPSAYLCGNFPPEPCLPNDLPHLSPRRPHLYLRPRRAH